ncbi:MAG: hypothetical protein AAFQ82_20910, partial [Myxococcota bacterium]
SFSADASRAFPAGMIGRVVSTDPKRVIVQTESTDQTYALVAFDPRSGGVTELVPSRPDAVLHICQRVGDSILAWYQDGKKYTLHRFDLDGNPKPFMVDGQERPHIEPADLGMPDWCNPGLSFTGDENSTSFTDFTVNSKLKSTRTFRIDLNSGALIPRLSGKEVDLDESKFVEYHGTFEARDGYPVPAHLWIPKSKLADVPEPLEIENGVLKKIHFRDGEKRMAQSDSYGSIGIVLNRGWNIYHQERLAEGVAVLEVGSRGGGEAGASSRNDGARNRQLTINDSSDSGYWLQMLGFDHRVDYGRSWGGWRAENGAVDDPLAFTHRISAVSAGDANRLVVNGPEFWSVHDWGAYMDPNTGETELATLAMEQANELSTPSRFRKHRGPLPSMLFYVQDDDDRAEPGSPQRTMNVLEQRFGQHNPRFSMISLPGGHGARRDRPFIGMWLRSQFGNFAPFEDQIKS